MNLFQYIDRIKSELIPPVSNKVVINDKIQVMVVGGPNNRRDFHVEMGEELFYQIKGRSNIYNVLVFRKYFDTYFPAGSMDLDVILDNSKKVRFRIKEGDMFILPAGIPHSPQRYADTIGLVFERMRSETEIDCLRWYKQSSLEVDYEEFFHCKDLGTQVKAVIENYNKFASNRENQSLTNTQPPKKSNLADHSNFTQQLSSLPNMSNIAFPRSLQDTTHQFLKDPEKLRDVLLDGEFRMTLIKGGCSSPSIFADEMQSINIRWASSNPMQKTIFLWQLRGKSQILSPSEEAPKNTIHSDEGDISLIRFEDPHTLSLIHADSNSCIVIISNKNA